MAAVDPYSLCPCGSGQKFKWCCHKVEAVADRAQRLFESGQLESALDAIEEGLKKEPGNAWLLIRKTLYLVRAGRPEPARKTVELVLQKNPKHTGAHMLLTRLALETEGVSAGVAQLQQALTALPAEHRKDLGGLVLVVGAFLSENGDYPAAWAHLNLVQTWEGREGDPTILRGLQSLQSNPAVSPWEKNRDTLSPPPAHLEGEARSRFEAALAWAKDGLWSSAAAAFEMLSDHPIAGPQSDRNLGFCRLWLAEAVAAVAALRRYASGLGPTSEAVDVETLCQQVAPPGSSGMVEQVQLTWPLRNRQALLAALRADSAINADEPGPLDPEEENSPEVDQFELLDRPALASGVSGESLKGTDIPRIVGRVLVGADFVILETFDDGRLDSLSDRFVGLAGSAIPPAHPKTKMVAKVPRLDLALMWEWLLPTGIDATAERRLSREQKSYLLAEVWPRTPNPALGGKTPLEAAAAGDSEVPLRAALVPFEQSRDVVKQHDEFLALRQRLNIPPEPRVDPAATDFAHLHLGRFAYVSAAELADEPLAIFYRRARESSLIASVIDAARRWSIARKRWSAWNWKRSRSTPTSLPSPPRPKAPTKPPSGFVAADRPTLRPSAPGTPPRGTWPKCDSVPGPRPRNNGFPSSPSSWIVIRKTRKPARFS